MIKHLVKTRDAKITVTKCGAKAGPDEVTIWYTEADCIKCRPYEYVSGPDGELRKVSREKVVSTPPPKTRVMKRRPKRS